MYTSKKRNAGRKIVCKSNLQLGDDKPVGKQSNVRKHRVVKLPKIHAQNKRGTNDTVSCYVFDSYIYPEWRKIKIVANKMPI